MVLRLCTVLKKSSRDRWPDSVRVLRLIKGLFSCCIAFNSCFLLLDMLCDLTLLGH